MSKVLIHHGVKGQKWGVRRYQNSDGSRTKLGKARLKKLYSPEDKVFISGKVKYDRPLDESLKKEIDKIIKSGSKILIGDAPGADIRVQDYLASKGYSNVVVYTTDKKVRNNVGNWKVERISGKGYSDEKSIRQQKDIAMTRASTRGLAIMPFDDRPDSAMSLNVQRMNEQGTPVLTYDYERGVWHSDILCHHGIKGQKWGVRRYQNKDGSLTAMGYEHYGYGKGFSKVKGIANKISNKVKADSKPPTGNQNCKLCTWSAEAQFRGMSNALPRAVYSPRDKALNVKGESIVEGAKRILFNNFSELSNKIDLSDNNARFYAHVNWKNSSGGHEFLIIKNGINKYVMDPQDGTITPFSNKSYYLTNINYKNSYIARLDDRPFNNKLFDSINNQKPIEFNPEIDIPYMYKNGMISREEY